MGSSRRQLYFVGLICNRCYTGNMALDRASNRYVMFASFYGDIRHDLTGLTRRR